MPGEAFVPAQAPITAVDPISGSFGQFIANTGTGTMRWHNGTVWADFAGGSGGGSNGALALVLAMMNEDG